MRGLWRLIGRAPLLLGCVFVGLLAACSLSSRGRPPRPLISLEKPLGDLHLPDSELESQRLFRVHYDGPEGEGSMRMILRLEKAESFQITASDSLGRALWALQADADGLLLLLHREKAFCRSNAELLLPETALAPLPVSSLPGVLLGFLPVPPQGTDADQSGQVDYRDSSGRRWTARREDGVLSAWTLWHASVPILWWTRQDRGGVLSHREGVQFRWREVVRESMREAFSRLEIPDDYREKTCNGPGSSRQSAGGFDRPFGDL